MTFVVTLLEKCSERHEHVKHLEETHEDDPGKIKKKIKIRNKKQKIVEGDV